MKSINWSEVKESGQGLAPGFYVIGITDVEDVPSKEYLRFTYDIAEGPEAGRYSDSWGEMNPWAHQFTASYKDTALGMFKGMLKAFEASNKGVFSADEFDGKESRFIGCTVGAAIQYRIYENDDHEEKRALEVRYTLDAEKVRNGDHKELPEPRDTREGATVKPVQQKPVMASYQAYEDVEIPFR